MFGMFKTLCIFTRANTTPEFAVPRVPTSATFLHTAIIIFRPLAIFTTMDSCKTTHGSEQVSKNTYAQSQKSCTEGKGHASNASRQTPTAAHAIRRDFHADKKGSRPQVATRCSRTRANQLHTIRDGGSPCCEHTARARRRSAQDLWAGEA